MSDKLADAFQEITRLNALVQSQKAELNLTLSNVERSTDELVLHAQNDRKAAEAREAALAVELEQVKEELATSRQDLQNVKDRQTAEQVKNDQQKYEQFVAYRDLWKKNSFAFETLTGLQTSLLHALGEFIEQEEESGPNEAAPAGAVGEEIEVSGAQADARTRVNEDSSSGTEMNMQIQRNGRVVSAVTRLNSAWLSEKKRREVAERNFSVCKKRLDRAMMQIESFQDQVSHLQASNALQESADVTFAEYEHWWNHFKHFQTPLPTSVLHNSGIKSGAAAATGPSFSELQRV
ncbi:Hypothetical Protein FCC1311_015052 [Hondaea fermentalgiana]|uniref:Uncharacterized protein n=1 Tax=Hondaea fermentalgiana TaxID=2315210 RepID=A0A2R5G678_9STRA|nr:Hypothetical Protein FCC1311_015052 [Hondaea fermentalgiana]|eukprot:GBG25288.1 Hypothetical Protein FCC1311_015052 [Hondaea fermentalgiana]